MAAEDFEKEKEPILFVDDEVDNLNVFKLSFKRYYKIFVADSAQKGLDIIKQEKIKVIISDQRMPIMTGVEFLRITSEQYPQAKRIILTGYTDVSVIIDSINKANIYRYLTKPWNDNDLKMAIDQALVIYNLEHDNKNLLLELADANSALENHNSNLEAIVKERTESLVQTISMKDKIFSIVAHDIKQPVSGIMGFSELLLKQVSPSLDEKHVKYLQVIHMSSTQLYSQICDLLTWARSHQNVINFNPRELLLENFIDITLSVNKLNIESKSITIDNQVRDIENCTVYADPDMLRLVINNILSNSVKFTPAHGKITIGIDKTDNGITIFVKDSGIGINAEQREKLFSSYVRSTTGTMGETGTGLGLTISHDFLKKHEGDIWVESQPNEGSTFFIRFPNKK